MPEDHFADIATRYDETAASMFDADVLGPTVDLLEGLDLMAELAGLSRRVRWAGWDRSPFTDESTSPVSVWEQTDP